MTLLDRFRKRPRWESEDPAVRAEGVREDLAADEQELIARLARGDADPRVRRAAARKVVALAVLAELAQGDADESVRREAEERLLEKALGTDEAQGLAAVALLHETRHIVQAARSSPLAPVRLAALGLVNDERQVATLAKLADDPAVRREALARTRSAELLAEIALKSDHKDVAVGAVDHLDDLAALTSIVARARHAGASRRARARLDALRPASVAEPAAAEAGPPEPAAEAAPGTAREPEAAPEPPAAEAAPPARPEAEAAPVVKEDTTAEPIAEAAAPAAPPADREAQERERRERLVRMEALAGRLEALVAAAALELRDADAALRAVHTAHEDLAHAPGKLAHRVRAARAALFAKTQPLREAEDWTRWSNAAIQEQLCERMESLGARDDVERAAREFHECDQRWAEARHAPRDEAEALRSRYQAARARVKAKLDSFFARKHAAEAENLARKQELAAKAEALAESTEWARTAAELRGLQARWKEIGPVPHRKSEEIWKRFRGACDRFFTRQKEDLKKRKDEWKENLAKKVALCVAAEALESSTEWEKAAAEVRRLQADWKAVGPVRRNQSEEVWQRFKKACDAFFDRYKRRDQVAAEARRAEREVLIAELEGLLPKDGAGDAPAEGLAAKVQAIQAQSRQKPLPPADEQALSERFLAVRGRLVAAYPEAFKGTELDPETTRLRKEKILAQVEAIAARAEPADEPLTGEALARRLKEALATNTMGGAAEAEARRRAEREQVEQARAAWQRLGPLPGEAGALLEERFAKAVARFPELRKGRERRPQSRIGAGTL
ncbi:MAG TPA: DUF349 domain-containing protein [Vicinamibacteria bacterium]|nr:DUF349 domain-containing protein [Vicinamibacteria bacterium]